MRKLFFLLAISITFLTSCNNDESSVNPNLILPKIIISTENGNVVNTANYLYSGNKIISIEGHDINKYYKYEYTYNLQSIITEKWLVKQNEGDNYELSNLKTFTYYNDGKIKSMEESRPGMPGVTKFDYTYNSDGSIHCVRSTVSQNEVYLWQENAIDTNNNNVVFINASNYNHATNSFGYFPSTKSLIYDTKNKVTKNILGYNELFDHNGLRSLNNNLLESDTSNTDSDTGQITITSVNYSYLYDTNNYPTTKNQYDENGNLIRTQTITYY